MCPYCRLPNDVEEFGYCCERRKEEALHERNHITKAEWLEFFYFNCPVCNEEKRRLITELEQKTGKKLPPMWDDDE